MRAYQLQTSQLLHVIRAMHREWAAQKVLSLEPVTGDGPPVFTDLTVERQRLVERAQLERDERLEERYDEAKRAAFQAEYDQQEIEFQGYIDKNARAEIQRALNAASQRLAPCMSPGIQNAVRHLNSATQYLYNGVHLIEPGSEDEAGRVLRPAECPLAPVAAQGQCLHCRGAGPYASQYR